MSDIYELKCQTCQKSVWVGQSGQGRFAFELYSGKETMEALRQFLWEHRGHSLVFDDIQVLERT